MTASKEFYIVSVANGQVLSQQPTGSPSALTAQYKGDQDKQQKWTVESGDEPNVVALKCTATGQYLNTKEVCSRTYGIARGASVNLAHTFGNLGQQLGKSRPGREAVVELRSNKCFPSRGDSIESG